MNVKLLSLMVVACVAQMANAQYAGYGSSGSAAVGYGSSGAALGYASSGSSVKSYGSSGSSMQSYGSSGSAATAYGSSDSAKFRPLRAIAESKPIRSRIKAMFKPSSVSASVPATLGSSKSQVAMASAQYRASNLLKGHAYGIESGYSTGVGFSTYNPNPRTCYGVGGTYASFRGADGWYSTKVL